MQLTATQAFNATPDRLYRAATNADFLAHFASSLGATAPIIAVTPAEDGATTDVQVQIDPGPLGAFTGGAVTIDQRLTWGAAEADGSRTGHLHLQVVGLPATLDAVARLAPAASGSTISYDGTFEVKLPFVGPMVESQAAPMILETLKQQEAAGNAWLAANPS